MGSRRIALLITAACAVGVLAGCASAQSRAAHSPATLTVSANASPGERLFRLGLTSTDNPVKFLGGGKDVGNGACANCHGDHAQGGSGPMISWTMLTTSQSMGNMPKYVYKTPSEVFATTISGVRPDGSRLNDAMPHYAMTRADFDELVAYLKTL